jgi:hypothetical protein
MLVAMPGTFPELPSGAIVFCGFGIDRVRESNGADKHLGGEAY